MEKNAIIKVILKSERYQWNPATYLVSELDLETLKTVQGTELDDMVRVVRKDNTCKVLYVRKDLLVKKKRYQQRTISRAIYTCNFSVANYLLDGIIDNLQNYSYDFRFTLINAIIHVDHVGLFERVFEKIGWVYSTYSGYNLTQVAADNNSHNIIRYLGTNFPEEVRSVSNMSKRTVTETFVLIDRPAFIMACFSYHREAAQALAPFVSKETIMTTVQGRSFIEEDKVTKQKSCDNKSILEMAINSRARWFAKLIIDCEWIDDLTAITPLPVLQRASYILDYDLFMKLVGIYLKLGVFDGRFEGQNNILHQFVLNRDIGNIWSFFCNSNCDWKLLYETNDFDLTPYQLATSLGDENIIQAFQEYL